MRFHFWTWPDRLQCWRALKSCEDYGSADRDAGKWSTPETSRVPMLNSLPKFSHNSAFFASLFRIWTLPVLCALILSKLPELRTIIYLFTFRRHCLPALRLCVSQRHVPSPATWTSFRREPKVHLAIDSRSIQLITLRRMAFDLMKHYNFPVRALSQTLFCFQYMHCKEIETQREFEVWSNTKLILWNRNYVVKPETATAPKQTSIRTALLAE